jgi:hypothetical protein
MANKLADLPVQVAATSTYALVVYQMSGQIPELNRLGLFVMMCVLVSLVAQTIGMILGTSLNVQVNPKDNLKDKLKVASRGRHVDVTWMIGG